MPSAFRVDRLRSLREKRGWSQRELAIRCGLSDSQINKYETGANDPSGTSVKAIAVQLGVSADYLLGLSDHQLGSYGDTLTPEESKLIAAYASGDSITIVEMLLQLLRQNEK